MGETTTEIELREHEHDATTETPETPPEATGMPRRTLVRRVQPDRANRRLSIRTRLFAGFGVVVALLALVAILGVSRLASFYGVTQELGKDGKRGELIAELTARTGQMKEAAVHQMLLDGPARAKGRQHIVDVTAQVQQAADALTVEAGADGRNRDWLTTALTAFKATLADYTAAQQQRILDASRVDALAFVTDPSDTGIGRYFSTIDDQLTAIHAAQNNDVSTVVDEAGSRYSSARAILLGAAILALLVGLTVAVLLARRLSRTLQFVVAAAGRLADGDLNARAKVKTRDEVGAIAAAFNVMAERLHTMVETERHQRAGLQQTVADISAFASRVAQGDLTARAPVDAAGELRDLVRNLNRMAESLASISGEVKRGSHEMSGTAAQILAAVSQHNASTAEQAASIAQTSVTIDEVRASAEQAAERAGSLASQAGQAAAYSDEGARAVDSLLTGMDEIGGRVAHVAAEIRELALRSEAIGDITDTVKELAEQSNMLALNATIEAAKAGEQGRGFAVVADEVRKLAEQSKQATTQVQAILQEIRIATANAVRATEEGTRVVEDGRARAGETGQILEQMTAAIRETATVATRIAAGAKEQAIGMDQIGQAIVEVSTTTGQISASAAQTEEAAGSLTHLAERLASQTRRYRVDADVVQEAPPVTPRRPRVPVPG